MDDRLDFECVEDLVGLCLDTLELVDDLVICVCFVPAEDLLEVFWVVVDFVEAETCLLVAVVSLVFGIAFADADFVTCLLVVVVDEPRWLVEVFDSLLVPLLVLCFVLDELLRLILLLIVVAELCFDGLDMCNLPLEVVLCSTTDFAALTTALEDVCFEVVGTTC